jgi:pimeloyl-ACP methyl ester carboxylesterase
MTPPASHHSHPDRTEEIDMPVTTENQAGATAIRPFAIPEVPDAELQALRARIAATRWPDQETVTDDSQGVPLAMVQELAGYWAAGYDWRRCEATLNALPHFITEIDGLDIHFIHVRSRHQDALPLIVTHGWPGSVIEQLKIIGPLTDPTAHGAAASDAFHLVIPSLPGYGYSGKPRATGWDVPRIARAWVSLMKRLGYPRFAAQGGDWGGAITNVMGQQAPPELLGIHVNFPGTVPPDIATARSDPGRRPGQHHAVLADQHRDLCGPPVLGKQDRPLQRRRRLGPGGRERLSRRELPGPAQLDRAGLSPPHVLQPAQPGRPLRGLGTAANLLGRGTRGAAAAARVGARIGQLPSAVVNQSRKVETDVRRNDRSQGCAACPGSGFSGEPAEVGWDPGRAHGCGQAGQGGLEQSLA